jgi:hypothetical protein
MSNLKTILLNKDFQLLTQLPEFESLNLQTHEVSTDKVRRVHNYWSMVSSKNFMQRLL